jgi:hypothetical protein
MTSTPPSVTIEVISQISGGPCSAVLRPHNFRRKAPHFWRFADGLSHCVNFQASAWGSRDAGRFTINLGVSSTALFEGFTGRRFPKQPSSALWPINVRIGRLMPAPADLWWDVDSNTDVAKLGDEIAAALRDYVLPFFSSLSTRQQLIAAVQQRAATLRIFPAPVRLVLAIVAAEDGDIERARSLLHSSLSDARGRPFEKTVRRIADRLAIPLERFEAKTP